MKLALVYVLTPAVAAHCVPDAWSPLDAGWQGGRGGLDASNRFFLDDLSIGYTRFHEFEHRSTLGGDPPATVCPLDQSLRKNIDIRNAGGKSPGPVGPVPAAGR